MRARTIRASRRVASDPRKVLKRVLQVFQPYVKDFSQFLQTVAKGLSHDWDNEFNLDGNWQVIALTGDSWTEDSFTGEQTYGYGRGDYDEPPEYDEIGYDYLDRVKLIMVNDVDRVQLGRILLRKYAPLIKDPQGFKAALSDWVSDTKAMNLLASLMAQGIERGFKTGYNASEYVLEMFEDRIVAFGTSETAKENLSLDMEWSIANDAHHSKVSKTWANVTGRSIKVFVTFLIDGEAYPMQRGGGVGRYLFAGIDWKGTAKRLLAENQGTDQVDLHYRAYLRAIIAGDNTAKELANRYHGARLARRKLINTAGK